MGMYCTASTDALYHEVRDPGTDPEVVRANRDEMRTASAQVVIPDGLGELEVEGVTPTHKKRGR